MPGFNEKQKKTNRCPPKTWRLEKCQEGKRVRHTVWGKRILWEGIISNDKNGKESQKDWKSLNVYRMRERGN